MNKIKNIETAPKDGTWILLHREKGDMHKARWIEKQDSLFRSGCQWVNEDGKFVDVGINKVIGWSEI